MKKKNIRINILWLVWLCLIFSGCRMKEEPVLITEQQSSESETASQEDPGSHDTETEQPGTIIVDISGAVKKPGVYELLSGARVYEAIEKAGGLKNGADWDSLNQAEALSDGQKIRIYTKEEAKELLAAGGLQKVTAGSTEEPGGGKVNLNAADESTLMTLPGIGEAKAAAIIAYRTEHGGFKNIDEIKNISGIKDAVFGQIQDKIEV